MSRWLLAGVVGLAVISPRTAGAQALQVQPLVIEFPAGESATSITVTNKDDQPATMQVRAFAWAQGPTGEQLTPADGLAFSPPFATIAPHSTQTIRVVLEQPPAQAESAYQLVMDDIPPPLQATGVHLHFRIKIPVFAEANPAAVPDIGWQLTAGPGGKLLLTGSNQGRKHLRIGEITLTGPGGRLYPVRSNGSFYILAGITRSWPITAAALLPGTPVQLTGTGEHGPVHAALIVGRAP